MAALEELLTLQQVADYLKVHRSTVHRMVYEDTLPVINIRSGRRKRTMRVKKSELIEFIEGRSKRMK